MEVPQREEGSSRGCLCLLLRRRTACCFQQLRTGQPWQTFAMVSAVPGTRFSRGTFVCCAKSQPAPPKGAPCSPCPTTAPSCPIDCWTPPGLAGLLRLLSTSSLSHNEQWRLSAHRACRQRPACTMTHGHVRLLLVFVYVSVLWCFFVSTGVC